MTDQNKYMEELVSMKQKAEELSMQKSILLANASHEIRTAMNVILGMSELCYQQERDEEIKYGLKNIYQYGQGLLEVVEDILDLSRMEMAGSMASKKNYSLEQLLAEVFRGVEGKLTKRNIKFWIQLQTEVPKVLCGDAEKVKTILVNLVENAEKYTETGEVYMVVSATPREEDVELAFEVHDTGMGMSPSDMDKIFLSFVRGRRIADSIIPGSGLGLAIVKQLVGLLDGNIWVESTEGVGSTFYVTVVQKKVTCSNMAMGRLDQEKIRGYLLKESKISGIIKNYDGVRALVVEDIEANALVAKGILEMYGLQAETAENIKQVFEQLQKLRPDIVFMDYWMPQMDGGQMLKKIRGAAEYQQIPVVALTASNEKEMQDYLTQLGFDDILMKPIKKRSLEHILDRYFSGSKWLKTMGRRDGNRKILASYYLQVSKLQEQLEQQAKEDISRFIVNIHGIKGASSSIGESTAVVWAEQLEQAAREGRMEDVESMFPQFDAMLTKTLQQVRTRMGEMEDAESRTPGTLDTKRMKELLGALEQFELDEAERILEMLLEYQYEPWQQKLVEELRDDILELEYEAAAGKITEFLGKIS